MDPKYLKIFYLYLIIIFIFLTYINIDGVENNMFLAKCFIYLLLVKFCVAGFILFIFIGRILHDTKKKIENALSL